MSDTFTTDSGGTYRRGYAAGMRPTAAHDAVTVAVTTVDYSTVEWSADLGEDAITLAGTDGPLPVALVDWLDEEVPAGALDLRFRGFETLAEAEAHAAHLRNEIHVHGFDDPWAPPSPPFFGRVFEEWADARLQRELAAMMAGDVSDLLF